MKTFDGGINNKGVSLVIVITIAVIVVFMVLAIMPLAINESQSVARWNHSIVAFYAAESGINRTWRDLISEDWEEEGWDTTNPDLYTLPLQPLVDSGSSIVSYYTAEINMIDPENLVAESTGFSPDTTGAERSIRTTFIKTGAVHITSLLEATGNIVITGNAEVEGTVKANAEFSFRETFGMSKETMKEGCDVIIDPKNNYQPVAGTTWFELVDKKKVMITSEGWEGEGLMIVEGDLEITGGDFEGVIWVIGDLDVAGNAEIEGAIFVEGDVKITGTPELEYDDDAVEDALDNANPSIPPYLKASWREIYK